MKHLLLVILFFSLGATGFSQSNRAVALEMREILTLKIDSANPDSIQASSSWGDKKSFKENYYTEKVSVIIPATKKEPARKEEVTRLIKLL